MKTIALIISILPLLAGAQWISTPTVIPAQPTTGDSIKVIIETMTPNLGHKLARSASIAKTGLVTIDICNYSGMLTAVQYYTDTFEIGQLSAGAWSLQVNYSISSNGGACTSQSVAGHSFTVSTVTGMDDFSSHRLLVYPNPAQNILTINAAWNGVAEMRDLSGRKIASWKKPKGISQMDISAISPGVYILCDEDNGFVPVRVVIER